MEQESLAAQRPPGPVGRVIDALWRRPILAVVLIALASRLFFITIAIVSAANTDTWPPGTWHRGPAWVQPFARWDSGYYLDIATGGYASAEKLWAFHPAYPILIRAAITLLPWLGLEAAAFLLANLTFLVAAPVFFHLTRDLFGSNIALRATILLCWFPPAFFFSAIYPESVFTLFLALSLIAFRRERWLAAGLWAAAANAARPQGLFIAAAYAAVLAFGWWRGRRPTPRAWTAPAAALSFTVLFSFYAWTQTGDPTIWLHARESEWTDVGWHDPFTAVFRSFTQIDNYGLSVIGLALFLAATAYAVYDTRRGAPPTVLAAHALTGILLVVHLVYAGTPSLLRYTLASFSLFWLLAALTRNLWTLVAVFTLSLALGAFIAHLFATWGPAF